MPRYKHEYDYDDDRYVDEQDEPTFQRLRKQTGKAIKNADRLQASKEFGKRINKMQKERRRYEGPHKP